MAPESFRTAKAEIARQTVSAAKRMQRWPEVIVIRP
jgi:hypothetical protein